MLITLSYFGSWIVLATILVVLFPHFIVVAFVDSRKTRLKTKAFDASLLPVNLCLVLGVLHCFKFLLFIVKQGEQRSATPQEERSQI